MPISIARLVLMEDSGNLRYEVPDPTHRAVTIHPRTFKPVVQDGGAEIMPFVLECWAEDMADGMMWFQDELLLSMLRKADTVRLESNPFPFSAYDAQPIAAERLAGADGPYNILAPGGWGHNGLLPHEARERGGRVLDLPGLQKYETFWLPRPEFLGIIVTHGHTTQMWLDLDRVLRIVWSPRRKR